MMKIAFRLKNRIRHRLFLFAIVFGGFSLSADVPGPGMLDRSFSAGGDLNGPVRVAAWAGNFEILIGGDFTTVAGDIRGHIARLKGLTNVYSFMDQLTGTDGPVTAIAMQDDGRILIGGDFTEVNERSRNRLARLLPDGTLDASFHDGLAGPDSSVDAILVQDDGKVIVAGAFTMVHGRPRNCIVRLNPDGSLDETFNSGLDNESDRVHAMQLLDDGRLLIAGSFDSIAKQTRGGIARLNSDGTPDLEFSKKLSGTNGTIFALAVQPDGKILIGGDFTEVNGAERGRIGRLLPNGELDLEFGKDQSGASDTVYDIAIQEDGKVLVAGAFTSINGEPRSGIARLSASGSTDRSFGSFPGGTDGTVFSIVAPAGGDTVWITGSFTRIDDAERNAVAAVLSRDGRVRPLHHDHSKHVYDMAMQEDRRVLVAEQVPDLYYSRLVRLERDGTFDTSFAKKSPIIPGPWDDRPLILAIAVQPDSRILVGGDFRDIAGYASNGIVRLEPDGTVDRTFTKVELKWQQTIDSIALQNDGKILIGGRFRAVNGFPRLNIARLMPDGTLDLSFEYPYSGVRRGVRSISLQSDGRVLVNNFVGRPQRLEGIRTQIERLNQDGSVDETFANGRPLVISNANTLVLQEDDKILIGGTFNEISGEERVRIARLNPDGALDRSFTSPLSIGSEGVGTIALDREERIIIGGYMVVDGERHRLLRLHPDGSVDGSFRPEGWEGQVRHIGVQSDGDLIVGGDFTLEINGHPYCQLLRLHGNSPANSPAR